MLPGSESGAHINCILDPFRSYQYGPITFLSSARWSASIDNHNIDLLVNERNGNVIEPIFQAIIRAGRPWAVAVRTKRRLACHSDFPTSGSASSLPTRKACTTQEFRDYLPGVDRGTGGSYASSDPRSSGGVDVRFRSWQTSACRRKGLGRLVNLSSGSRQLNRGGRLNASCCREQPARDVQRRANPIATRSVLRTRD